MKIETKTFTECNGSAIVTVVLDSEAKEEFLLNGFKLTIKERPQPNLIAFKELMEIFLSMRK